jgi:hypothetical protein
MQPTTRNRLDLAVERRRYEELVGRAAQALFDLVEGTMFYSAKFGLVRLFGALEESAQSAAGSEWDWARWERDVLEQVDRILVEKGITGP